MRLSSECRLAASTLLVTDNQSPAKELMQPLQQTGPLVALRFVLLGDPDGASLLAQELDIGTQKHTNT